MARKKKPKVIHQEVTPWYICHFVSEQIRRLELVHAEVRNLENKIPVEVRAILAWGVVQHLASLQEAVKILREMGASFTTVAIAFKPDFDHWRGFRDDAAHVADRLFRVSGACYHDAVVPDPKWGRAVEVLGYEYKTDAI